MLQSQVFFLRQSTGLVDDSRMTLQKKWLKQLLSKTETKADFQRVQCIWLRVALDLSFAER